MNNAQNYSCEILHNPKSTKFSEDIRIFQGCPTVAITKGGRIYAGWYAGGLREPHMDNYNILVYSDDLGKSWSEPIIVIPSNYEKKIHALDIQLFIDKDGALHVFWVQNNVSKAQEIVPDTVPNAPDIIVDGYHFNDFGHNEWEMVCYDPDSEKPVFTQPRYVFGGFLRCKPTVLDNGDWLCFNYDQLNQNYGYSISKDNGQTFTHYYGAKKLGTIFDEAMAYQKKDGAIRMFARTYFGELSESYSYDGGISWSEAKLSGIVSANSRFYVSRLPSGRIILILNDDREVRQNMTVLLSEDDGETWKYKLCIDQRADISYPDAEYYNGRIYLIYDRGRESTREILFTSFTEEDIIKGNEIKIDVISAPKTKNKFYRESVIKQIDKEKLIAILRNIPDDKLIPLAEALYNGGIRLLEITYSSDLSRDVQTAENIKKLTEHFGDRMMIGAGTVITTEQVRLTKAAGGLFIISPNADSDIIKETYRTGMVSIAGALTPTEIVSAHKTGADYVKLFPINNLGVDYVKAVKAPLSHIKLLAVGGINEKNIKDYLTCGVSGFGIGSNITPKKLLENEDYDSITEMAKSYVEAVTENNG